MTNTQNFDKKVTVAVFLGGRSPEHDVSVVSALQVLSAIDPMRYDAFPVYVDPQGGFWTGNALKRRENYLLTEDTQKTLLQVNLEVQKTKAGLGRLVQLEAPGLFKKPQIKEFDIAFPVFHGVNGEDGSLQGLFDFIGIPYAGMRGMASSIFMDKVATKLLAQSLGIDVLPCAVFERPKQGLMIPQETIKEILKISNVTFPACLKPSHLGSSIGVAKCENIEDVAACLPAIFKYDDTAILEPFVENLVEYNVAVSKLGDEITKLSAVERPKTSEELLDFKEKYLAGGSNKSGKLGGTKSPEANGGVSEGMLSLTRELNPKLPKKVKENIEIWGTRIFDGLGGTGAPRIDFIANEKTKDIWLNEVNPCPGSLGYFLWEAAEDSILFTDFISLLISEGIAQSKMRSLPDDPVPEEARLLKRS